MIYDNVKALCKERGLSISAVEKQAGLGNGTIRGWNESSPTIDNIQSVAKVLKVNVNKLLE